MRDTLHDRILCAALIAGAILLHGMPIAAQNCIGDCPPTNGQVGVNELILGVNISLGSGTLTQCPSYDNNSNSMVGVEELIAAVNNSLRGCGAATPTPRPTSPPPTGGSTPSVTPTVTWTPAQGPRITFFGVTLADDTLQRPTPGPIPVYERPFGLGFKLVVEANGQLGPNATTFSESGAPDLQVQVTRDLGNGSSVVCDNELPDIGGIPGIDPPQLENPDSAILNDLGCRFIDGTGSPNARTCGDACIRYEDGEFACESEDATVQFCAAVSMAMQFPDGDTLVTARVRDRRGALGSAAQIIIRVTGVPPP